MWPASKKELPTPAVYHQFRQGVNFINILQTVFSTILLHRKTQTQTGSKVNLCLALLYEEAVRKMLMKFNKLT
jgi:hypothetical protein